MATKKNENDSNKRNIGHHHGSVYRIYKHATETAFDWGREMWLKHSSKKGGKEYNKKKSKTTKRKAGKNNNNNRKKQMSLSEKIDTLVEVMSFGKIDMPDYVRSQLDLAIQQREKMSRIYSKLPTTTEQAMEGHQHIIQQLKLVRDKHEEILRDTAAATTMTATANTRAIGFELLQVDDDNDEEEEEGNTTVPQAKSKSTTALSSQNKPSPIIDLKKEEKSFHIACALRDIVNIRNDIRRRWRQYFRWKAYYEFLLKQNDEQDDEAIMEKRRLRTIEKLVTVVAFTKMSMHMIRVLDNEMQLLFEVNLLEDIIWTFDTRDIQEQEFESKASVVATEKLASTTSNTSESDNNHDDADDIDTFKLLCTVSNVLRMYGACDDIDRWCDITVEHSKTRGHSNLLMETVESGDVKEAIECLVRDYFPLWWSYNEEEYDFNLLDFECMDRFICEGTFDLQFAVMVLVIADNVFMFQNMFEPRGDSHLDFHWQLVNQDEIFLHEFLCELCDKNLYDVAHDWVANRSKSNIPPDHDRLPKPALVKLTNVIDEQLPMVHMIPMMTGDLLLSQLQQYLRTSLFPAICLWHDLHYALHLYHMLLVEGYIGRISLLDKTLIGMFQQDIFFRGGLTKSGDYMGCVARAAGHRIEAPRQRRTKQANGGYFKKEMCPRRMTLKCMNHWDVSRLEKLFQNLEKIPLINRDDMYNEIYEIVKVECSAIFVAPLMFATCQAVSVLEDLVSQEQDFVARAGDFAEQFFPGIEDDALTKVMNYAMSLGKIGDDFVPRNQTEVFVLRCAKHDRDPGLQLIADVFRTSFVDDVGEPEECDAIRRDAKFDFNDVVRLPWDVTTSVWNVEVI